MDAYLAIVDRSGLRALLNESLAAAHVATEMLSSLPASTCYWVIVEQATATIVRELLEEAEPSLAMRMLQSQAHECGPATLTASQICRAA